MTIADYIERDLRHRLETGTRVPEPLTLAGIAGAYGVSATPVRRAVERLVEGGAIERLPSGRLGLPAGKGGRRRGRRRRSAPPERPTDWEEVIGRHILERAIVGPTGPVHEEELCERFGVGRTVLRRVLGALSGGDLVHHVPRRGWSVSAFSKDDCLAFIDVRATLEVQALDLARGRLEPAVLERMIDGNGPDAVAAGDLDNDLHGYIVERAGNRYIASFFEVHGRDYQRLFDSAAVEARVVREMAASHVAILEHARRGRWARARSELREHIHAQGPVLGRMIDALLSTH